MKFATGLTVYNTEGDLSDLSIRLPANAFAPCASLQWSSAGWVPPVADNLVERVNGASVICLRVQKKLLPAAAIKERAALEIERIEKTECRVVGRKERKALIEQVTDSLLPGALTKSSQTLGWIDEQTGRLFVATASKPGADAFVDHLRAAFGSAITVTEIKTNIAPLDAMTKIFCNGGDGEMMELLDVALLKSPVDGSAVRVSRADLTSDEIVRLATSGRLVCELGLSFSKRTEFRLVDAIRLRGIRYSDITVQESIDGADDKEALARAVMEMQVGELRMLSKYVLDEILGGENVDVG